MRAPKFVCFINIIRMLKQRRRRWARHVARMINAYKIVVGNPEWKRPLGKSRLRWEDNIKMNLKEILWEGVVWVHLSQDRDCWRALVGTVMNLRVP
jgi:hypothetical protein